jgi:dTDP-glucose 4,6-dehydratase
MKHIVVGAAGFTGQHLVRRLVVTGQRVLSVDTRPVDQALLGEGSAYIKSDIRRETELEALPIEAGDIVHHLAARQYHERVPRTNRDAWFAEVNVDGTRRLLARMARTGCSRMIYFSTDMVYGVPRVSPVPVTHTQEPLGPYGCSKRLAEQVCREFRERGMSITILRPRLIVGPGRFGVLEKLFALVARHLPVPMIGSGENRYQMVSVHDCVSADLCAVKMELPNAEFNLGSDDPPRVKDLLHAFIRRVGSRSILFPLPARPLKGLLGIADRLGIPLMYPEQAAIADATYVVDTSATKQGLGWIAEHSDVDMLARAYEAYLAKHRRTMPVAS